MAGKRRSARYKDWITPEGITKIKGWARDGLINEQIAENIGIHPSTLYDWQGKYSEIEDALKEGKDVIDRQVESALLNKALGYREMLDKVKILGDGTIVRYVEEAFYPADTTAQIFWLKNRKPAEWRDRQNIEHSGEISISARAKEIEAELFGG